MRVHARVLLGQHFSKSHCHYFLAGGLCDMQLPWELQTYIYIYSALKLFGLTVVHRDTTFLFFFHEIWKKYVGDGIFKYLDVHLSFLCFKKEFP